MSAFLAVGCSKNAKVEAPVQEANAVEEVKAADACDAWAGNALFKYGNKMRYSVEFEGEIGAEMEDADGEWVWDPKRFVSRRDIKGNAVCTSERVETANGVCAVEVSCVTDDPVQEGLDLPISGKWYINEAGIFHAVVGSEEYNNNTYDDSDYGVMFRSGEDNVTKHECEDDIVCSDLTISRKGTERCRDESHSAGDSMENRICIDDVLGITEFNSEFSGGMYDRRSGKIIKD